MNTAEMVLEGMTRKIRRNMHKLLGNVSLVKPILDKLKINSIFEEVMKASSHREKVSNGLVSEVMILNRLVSPMPLYDVEEWVDNETCVGDIYNVVNGSMNDDRIADFLDDIHPLIPNIWNRIISNATVEYNIPVGMVYNDITSMYFEGVYDESTLIKRGYSRDQKPDKKQINIGINSNSVGIPLAYSILSGNTADKATVIGNMEKVINTIKQTPRPTTRPMIVGDRAMLDNKIAIAYHNRGDIDYLGTLKLTNAMRETIAKIPDAEYKLIDTKRLNGLYEGYEMDWTFSYNGKEVTDKALIVKSEQKYRTDQNQRRRVIEKYTNALEDLKGKLNKGKYKKVESVQDRVDSLREEYTGSDYVEVTIDMNSKKQVELAYKMNEQQLAKDSVLDGKYMMATNRKDMTPEEMLGDYKTRDISEKNFSILKGPLHIRPIFLHKEERIEALVFLSIVALMIYSILKLLIIENEIDLSINRAFHHFKTLGVTLLEFVDDSNVRIVGDLNWTQKEILDKLVFPYPAEYVNFAG